MSQHANLDSAPRYRNDLDRHVGLYAFVIMTPWRWHLGAETCRSWYMS